MSDLHVSMCILTTLLHNLHSKLTQQMHWRTNKKLQTHEIILNLFLCAVRSINPSNSSATPRPMMHRAVSPLGDLGLDAATQTSAVELKVFKYHATARKGVSLTKLCNLSTYPCVQQNERWGISYLRSCLQRRRRDPSLLTTDDDCSKKLLDFRRWRK